MATIIRNRKLFIETFLSQWEKPCYSSKLGPINAKNMTVHLRSTFLSRKNISNFLLLKGNATFDVRRHVLTVSLSGKALAPADPVAIVQQNVNYYPEPNCRGGTLEGGGGLKGGVGWWNLSKSLKETGLWVKVL